MLYPASLPSFYFYEAFCDFQLFCKETDQLLIRLTVPRRRFNVDNDRARILPAHNPGFPRIRAYFNG